MTEKFRKLIKRLSGDRNFADAFRGSASNFIIRIFGLFAGYIFTLIIVRIFGASVLGAHTISSTVLMMFTIFGRMGMDIHIVKRFAGDRMDHRWDRIHEVYRKTLLIAVVLGIVLTGIFYFSAAFIATQFFHKAYLEPYFKIMAFAVLPMTLRFINSECYRGFGLNRQYVYSQNVGYFIYASIILGGMSLFSKNELLPNIAFTASLAILAVSSTILIFKKIKSNTDSFSDNLTVGEWIRTSSPMMMAGSLLLISGWINTLILGAYCGDAEVGIYSVILKITNFANFVLMSVNGIATPKFAQLHKSGDLDGLQQYVKVTTKITFWASAPILLFMFLFNDWLLSLFGAGFIAGSSALLITTFGKLIGVFTGSTGNLLNMTGHQKDFRNIMTAATILNIVLCMVLIPTYGLTGSAIASAAFIASWNIACVVYIRRKLGIRSYYSPF